MAPGGRKSRFRTKPGALLALPAVVGLLAASLAGADPFPLEVQDFQLPGTQPLTVTDNFATPDECAGCHADYGQLDVEPFRNWQGSMMGQAGRDPLMWAALAVANQDADHAGETCLRCHLPKGWLEGRSAAADGSMMTADDRHGVQCSICHRMVDPFPDSENPPEDDAILAGLAEPVTTLTNAQMVMDPEDRLRGPFDVEADLGSDPHSPTRETIVSPFHTSSELCGVCHTVRLPIFTRNPSGEYEPNAVGEPGDPALAFPEQATYDEWVGSAYATTGIFAPQFGINKDTVSSCQDCHMPDVSGRDADTGVHRDDLPLHEFLGGNTFIPAVLPFHPVFGEEVDAGLLLETVDKNRDFLRKAATVSAELAGAELTVTVQNETGHKLPTGYPEGRRMWLHVRAFDADRNVVFESGRYVFSEAELLGHHALPEDPDYDPYLKVWEAIHGISPDWALIAGVTPGPSSHLALNNVREFDNRLPPRGFTHAAYDPLDATPIPDTFADGQFWDDVVYPVGAAAVQAEVVLYYQTASREYVEFLRDANVTNVNGNILFDLWDQHGRSEPVAMARVFVETNPDTVARCHKNVSKAQAKYLKTYAKEWARCYAREAGGFNCDTARRDAKIASAEAKLGQKLGGSKDSKCSGASLSPATLGHGSVCPVPCPTLNLFDMSDLTACLMCMAQAVASATLDAAYGASPPDLPTAAPGGDPAKCQKSVAKAATGLASTWTGALLRCENDNASGKNTPPADCSADPDGRIGKATEKADKKIAKCSDFSGLAGCPSTGTVADTQACVEAAVGAAAPPFTEVAYP